MAEDIDDGKSVQLGEFGIFSPTIRAKSADDEKDISSKSIIQRKIIFYPGKIFKDTLEDMSITCRVEIETDYTDGSSNGGNNGGNPDSGDVTDDSNELWYTVFVNENVYDVDGEDRHPLDDWLNYVNKDPRSVL